MERAHTPVTASLGDVAVTAPTGLPSLFGISWDWSHTVDGGVMWSREDVRKEQPGGWGRSKVLLC